MNEKPVSHMIELGSGEMVHDTLEGMFLLGIGLVSYIATRIILSLILKPRTRTKS